MNAQAKLTALAIAAGVVLFIAANALYVVPQTKQALVLQFGRYVKTEQEPGLKWKMPFLQNVEFYDNRLLSFDTERPTEVTANDQKRVLVDAFVRYRIVDPLKFKQTVGDELTMRSRLNAFLDSSLRQVIGQEPLQTLISDKRGDIMKRVQHLVNAQAEGAKLDDAGNLLHGEHQGFGIEVVDVRIVRADLPKENSESIYRRMQTEREQEAKQWRAEGAERAQKIRAEADRDRTIMLAEARKRAEQIRGQGDQEATRIFAEAFGQDAEFFKFYRSMQAYRKSLGNKDTTLILSPDSEFLEYMERGANPAR